MPQRAPAGVLQQGSSRLQRLQRLGLRRPMHLTAPVPERHTGDISHVLHAHPFLGVPRPLVPLQPTFQHFPNASNRHISRSLIPRPHSSLNRFPYLCISLIYSLLLLIHAWSLRLRRLPRHSCYSSPRRSATLPLGPTAHAIKLASRTKRRPETIYILNTRRQHLHRSHQAARYCSAGSYLVRVAPSIATHCCKLPTPRHRHTGCVPSTPATASRHQHGRLGLHGRSAPALCAPPPWDRKRTRSVPEPPPEASLLR